LTDRDWRSYTAAILGSGLVVFTVTTLYSSFINKPIISIDLSENSTIMVTNKGLAPATDLILTIYTNRQITNPALFSTENITVSTGNNTASVTQSDGEILQIRSARLASGHGSNIIINLLNSSINDVVVYATYDQGSVRVPPPIISPYDVYFSASPIMITSIGAIISLIYFIERRSKHDMLRFMAAKVYRDVRDVAMKLEGDLFNDQILLDDHRRDGAGMYSNKIWANPEFEEMKVKFFDKEDLDKLYKFFILLLERDSVIKEKSSSDPLGQRRRSQKILDANDKLKRAAQSANKDINWEKYAGFKFIKFYVLGSLDSKMTVKFRKLFTVKDWRYALYQIISIGLIVVVIFYPALFSISQESFAPIVYAFTGILLFLFLFGWWEFIDKREVRRSVFEEFEIEMEKERARVDLPKKDKEEVIDLYRDEAEEKLKRLRRTVIGNKR
jgi:hypothetical protein